MSVSISSIFPNFASRVGNVDWDDNDGLEFRSIISAVEILLHKRKPNLLIKSQKKLSTVRFLTVSHDSYGKLTNGFRHQANIYFSVNLQWFKPQIRPETLESAKFKQDLKINDPDLICSKIDGSQKCGRQICGSFEDLKGNSISAICKVRR